MSTASRNYIARKQSAMSTMSGNRRSRFTVGTEECYSYALRVGLLSYLLQPRRRVTTTVAAPAPARKSYSSSAADIMQEFTRTGASRSTKLPKVEFLTALQKRLEGVVTGREANREYNDANIRRTFAVFLNQLMEPRWRGSVNKSRRAEDLILIFVAHATRELTSAVQSGSVAGVSPDNVGLLVDRHIALFVRLLLLCLKDNGWASGHPELVTRLSTLESKLLMHDQNLVEATTTSPSSLSATTQVTEEAALTYSVSEMPLVQTVARVFQVPISTVQNEINKNKAAWTDAAAVSDLRTYTDNINLNRTGAFTSDDFDTDAGYDTWKKEEIRAVGGIIAQMVSNNLDLRSVTSATSHSTQSPTGDVTSPGGASSNGYGDRESSYTFIPPSARNFLRVLFKTCLIYDLQNPGEVAVPHGEEYVLPILNRESVALIEECCLRWRIPHYTKAVVLLDAVRDNYAEGKLDLDAVDKAFEYLHGSVTTPWEEWTISDQNMQRKTLAGFHDALLRELYHAILQCFDQRPPPITIIQYVLDNHIYTDPLFSGQDMEQFISSVKEGLKVRAGEIYGSLLEGIPDNREEWDMYHVVDLGKKILGLAQRLSKKFAEPLLGKINVVFLTIEVIFPTFAEDCQKLIKEIFKVAQEKKEELDMQDAFDMYKKLVEVRDVYDQVLPNKPFPFSVEDIVQDFVWRWLNITDSKVLGWVDAAVREDNFRIHNGGADAEGKSFAYIPDQRNSSSVSDIFLSFNQSIKTVKDLQWADEFQSARFFTALSKSIGNGLTHYCEILEAMFTKEMDRLTPEQEAAKNQTQKEKLFAYFNSKEKVVPFNFFPETCVKFNNVEYAIQHLDLIERSINVDRCASIIAKNTPYNQQRRQVNNYMFTIKIVEAEDLKACDINGLSDPYVVLGDEFRKRLAKTRVVYSTLNPRFDETVEITTQGPVLLTATIWDFDTVGSHDYVGRSSIKLDPSFFGDYLPREYWLDLDTQGRLLLKVSMEGERDDIQFYFGRTFRTLKRTERDMSRLITDKCSAYIHHCLSRATLKSLLSSGISISAVSSYFSRTGFGGGRPQSYTGPSASEQSVAQALTPLFDYFNENFQILNQTLTEQAMVNVMTRLWKEVLVTLEALLVPPLSDKPSNQKPLQQQEVDIVFKWLKLLFDFFQAVDENGVSQGVQIDILKSPKYHDLQSVSFFYNESTESLIRTSERMAAATNQKAQQQQQKSVNLGVPGSGALLLGLPMAKRSKSVMMNRNLGTMRKAKEEKRKEAQAEPSDDMILRILRMRPEAAGYLRARSQQKERIAAQRAAEAIVQQSINAGKGRLTAGGLPGNQRR